MFRLILLAMTILPSAALAHEGHSSANPFWAGLAHPISGADHVLAMVGVGLWAAILGGRALVAMPLAFVVAMLAGGVAGAYGLVLPGVEPMIAASIILIGAAAALALRPTLSLALCALAVFGTAHGFAHGVEGPVYGLAPYALGFVLATGALHGAGVALGLSLAQIGAGWLPRGLGAATAAAGLGLAGGAL